MWYVSTEEEVIHSSIKLNMFLSRNIWVQTRGRRRKRTGKRGVRFQRTAGLDAMLYSAPEKGEWSGVAEVKGHVGNWQCLGTKLGMCIRALFRRFWNRPSRPEAPIWCASLYFRQPCFKQKSDISTMCRVREPCKLCVKFWRCVCVCVHIF